MNAEVGKKKGRRWKLKCLRGGFNSGIIEESEIARGELLEELLVEADELVAIFTTIGKKSK